MVTPCMSCGQDRHLPAPEQCRHRASHVASVASIDDAIAALQASIEEHAEVDEFGFYKLDDQTRWKLHVLASSIEDNTFWVRKDADDPSRYQATEVETGMSAYGMTPGQAMHNYFAGNFTS